MITKCRQTYAKCTKHVVFSSVNIMNRNYSSASLYRSINTTILISIEGNIGAGKSTIMDYLKVNHPQFNYIDEPLNVWSSIKNDDGKNLLETYYSERCLDTDYHCFSQMLKDNGNFTKLECQIYDQFYNHFKSLSVPLKGIIYVDTPPEQCQQRVRARSRRGEDSISLEYLQALDSYTKKWIDSYIPTQSNHNLSEKQTPTEIPTPFINNAYQLPVLTVNGNQTQMNMEKIEIEQFIDQLVRCNQYHHQQS